MAGFALLFGHPLARCDFRKGGAKILFFPLRRVRTGNKPDSAKPDNAREKKESEQGRPQQNRCRLRTMAQTTINDNAIEPASTAGRGHLLERKEGALAMGIRAARARSSPVDPH